MRFAIDLSDAEWERLQALARARDRSEEQCVRDFIAACQPGGSGWKHPANAEKPKAD